MAKRKIDAREAVHYIRLGVDDYALMARYNLSTKGLQSLFRKLVAAGAITQAELDNRPYISSSISIPEDTRQEVKHPPQERRLPQQVIEVVRDIKAGMSDSDLMTKYQLSARGLQHLFERLIAAELITQADLDKRVTTMEATVDLMWLIKELGLDSRLPTPTVNTSPIFSCPACGTPQTIAFDECPECGANIREFKRKHQVKERAKHTALRCPVCDRPWNKNYDECPICGVIVSKLK